MHSVRRAVLRAAGPSSRVLTVPRQQVASFAMQMSKQNVRPATTLLLARSFSQTPRAAEEETASGLPQSSLTESQRSRTGVILYVGNLSYEATETHIHEAFSKYGEVKHVNIIRDQQGRSKGYAFVTYPDAETCNAAIDGANQSFWLGRRLNVNLSQPRKDDQKTAARTMSEPTQYLYIGNIPYETSDADLNAIFRDLEGVTDVRVAVDRNTGWPRGFAHADFKDVEAATKAFAALSALKLGGRTLRLDYATRENKGRESTNQTRRHHRQ